MKKKKKKKNWFKLDSAPLHPKLFRVKCSFKWVRTVFKFLSAFGGYGVLCNFVSPNFSFEEWTL